MPRIAVTLDKTLIAHIERLSNDIYGSKAQRGRMIAHLLSVGLERVDGSVKVELAEAKKIAARLYGMIEEASIAIGSLKAISSPDTLQWFERLAKALNRIMDSDFITRINRASNLAKRLEQIHETALDMDRLERICRDLKQTVQEARDIESKKPGKKMKLVGKKAGKIILADTAPEAEGFFTKASESVGPESAGPEPGPELKLEGWTPKVEPKRSFSGIDWKKRTAEATKPEEKPVATDGLDLLRL